MSAIPQRINMMVSDGAKMFGVFVHVATLRSLDIHRDMPTFFDHDENGFGRHTPIGPADIRYEIEGEFHSREAEAYFRRMVDHTAVRFQMPDGERITVPADLANYFKKYPGCFGAVLQQRGEAIWTDA